MTLYLYPSLKFGIRRGAVEDLLTTAFYSSVSSAIRMVFLSSSPVDSLMLSSQRFSYLPPLLPPFTVPCIMVMARPDERVVCTYHSSFPCPTMVRRSTCGPMAFSVLHLTSSFVICSLYEIPSRLVFCSTSFPCL
ncbi:hypothetical protein ElyMa_002050700 [Elysia marginata]|uniref:Uncharacterized protein n=1 Tax=Elysia marginata TaxID=1093978 RepID=A0AAV4F8R1_9GAST|nr:hypothetical protein ElyMa_002050700 [Elysia marginata]